MRCQIEPAMICTRHHVELREKKTVPDKLMDNTIGYIICPTYQNKNKNKRQHHFLDDLGVYWLTYVITT
jgi:hypothetical protein